MRTDLWGSSKGILIVCFLLLKFEQRSLNGVASSCGRGYFRKRSSCGRGYFFIRIKKDAFSKISGYVWTRPYIYGAICWIKNSHLLLEPITRIVSYKTLRIWASNEGFLKLSDFKEFYESLKYL